MDNTETNNDAVKYATSRVSRHYTYFIQVQDMGEDNEWHDISRTRGKETAFLGLKKLEQGPGAFRVIEEIVTRRVLSITTP